MTSYVPYPSDSVHARAIARRLSASPAIAGDTADYLIFQQRDSEGSIDIEALEYFRSNAAIRGREVVFLPSYRSVSDATTTDERTVPEWAHVIDPADATACIQQLAALRECGVRFWPQAGPGHCLAEVKQLFLEAIGSGSQSQPTNSSWQETVTDQASDRMLMELLGPEGVGCHFWLAADTISSLLASSRCDDFYYLLALMSRSYSDQSHELTKIDARLVGSRSFQALGRQVAAKTVLVAAACLRETMQAPALPGSDGAAFQVLVIDDDDVAEGRIPSYGRSLARIAATFHCPAGWKILVWNPMRNGVELFRRLCQYRSFDADPQLGDWKITVRDLASAGASRDISLKELADGFKFILVDLLYRSAANGGDLSPGSTPTSRQRGQVRGPELIRGLERSLRDLAVGGGSAGLPQIIVLSRDDDPALIQQAIRSGARDYVLKTQLLRLPAVMSKVGHSTGAGGSSPHRNFPELYRLPRETQGLLRAVCIPGVRALHRNAPEPRDARPQSRIESEVSTLLRTIPKSDLHIHAGSCMSPEFLVVAAAVGLARSLIRELGNADNQEDSSLVSHRFGVDVGKAASVFRSLAGFHGAAAGWEWRASDRLPGEGLERRILPGEKWLATLGEIVREDIVVRLRAVGRSRVDHDGWKAYQGLRALLHAELAIRDRYSLDDAIGQVAKLTDLDAAFFGVRFGADLARAYSPGAWPKDDLVRIYLLTLAASGPYAAKLMVGSDCDLLELFRAPSSGSSPQSVLPAWLLMLGHFFTADDGDESHSLPCYRRLGWGLPATAVPLRLTMSSPPSREDSSEPSVTFTAAPIEYTVSTGLRSANLIDYLEGCEFTGAEHLRHPFLIHLFAQQVVSDLVRKGVFYAELRAAPDGYADPALGFEFPHVCRCLEEAFNHAQRELFAAYLSEGPRAHPPTWIGDALGARYSWSAVSRLLDRAPAGKFLPCKVSLIYVGKRHKPTREMILEAAAAAVMRPSGENAIRTAKEFAEREFPRCRVVGFDLAGKEVGNPPERFVEEFGRLARLHIPLTVHAGENESAQFVEDSILRLRARRIGHGLSLVEDGGLVTRVREDRVGIELCPVSNFQTSHFSGLGGARPYPLRGLLAAGILVSINTDNPVISHTNMVREFFQASYAWGDWGMPLWEALALVRMGFVMSFLSLPERRAVLEIVGQYLFDFFSEESTVEVLRELSRGARRGQGSDEP
jgi:adenosine deaminase